MIIALCFLLCSMFSASMVYAEDLADPQSQPEIETSVTETSKSEMVDVQTEVIWETMTGSENTVLNADATAGVEDLTYTIGSTTAFSIPIISNGNTIAGVQIDEETTLTEGEQNDYSVSIADSLTTIEFYSLGMDKLSRLTDGKHTLTITFEDSSSPEIILDLWVYYNWGTPYFENDKLYYIESDGATSAALITGETSWLLEDSSGQSAWFGLDPVNNSIASGSRFHVKWLDQTSDSANWTTYYSRLDGKHKSAIEDNHMMLFDIGMKDFNGAPHSPNDAVSLYVQLPDGWDADELKAAYVDAGNDEDIQVSPVDGEDIDINGGSFAKLTLSHFSPYVLYDEATQAEKDVPAAQNSQKNKASGTGSPDTGDTSSPDTWMALMLLSGLTALLLKPKTQ